MVTRTGISRALWNSPQDCPTRPGPPASPRPDGLFDSRTEPYKRQNKRKSTCLTRKQVLLVTRTGISRALWNSPQDCPTRPGPPASPRPDGLFDSRTEPYKRQNKRKSTCLTRKQVLLVKHYRLKSNFLLLRG